MLPRLVTTGVVLRAPVLATTAGVAVLVTAGVLVTAVGVVTTAVVTPDVCGSKTLESVGCIKPAVCALLLVPVAVPPALGVSVSVDAVFDTPVLVFAGVSPPVPAWPREALARRNACTGDLLHAQASDQTQHATSCACPSV